MRAPAPGVALAATVTSPAALGFVPVAIYFDLFATLVRIGKPATSEQITNAANERRSEEEKQKAPLCPLLTHDTLFAVAGLGFVELVEDDVYEANSITRHMVNMPSAQHGALHFTTEPLLAGAFLMRKLVATNFEYPFKDLDTPTQYAYKLMGEEELAKEHTYSIMAKQGRMDSFNQFMESKFGKFGRMPERVKAFGYDLDAAVLGTESPIVMVDIGGGRGEMLLELKEAYPHLQPSNLVLQEFNPDIGSVPEITQMEWNFKDGSPQPVQGALNYSLKHIFHNLPDLDALELMQKISRAMAPYSRLLIHEFTKNKNYGKMHATMITLYGGRLRSSSEWKRLAALCGLTVTFEAYPEAGEGLIEMRKL
ncbi:hypothetical protein VTN77DRAFT_5896 [Rasamsonia byssochlamydoides]|uniref:uncharacterized protein n=1 Tax=Rasamsonia byssochlamydoides TaxID=89139 RepID=UPI003743678F